MNILENVPFTQWQCIFEPRSNKTGITTYRNGPERTETDPRKYRNGLLWVPKRTGTDSGLQWVPKRTGTDFSSYRNELQYGRKGRVGHDRNNPNSVLTYLPTHASSNQSTIYLTVTYLPTCKLIPTYQPSYTYLPFFYLLNSPLLSYITLHIVISTYLP